MPQVVAGAIISAAGITSALGVALVTATVDIGFALAASELAKAMAPKPKALDTVGISGQSTVGENVSEGFILGRFATQGDASYPDMTHGTDGGTPNAFLTQRRELSGVAGCTLNRVALNGEWVTLGADDGSGYGRPLQGRYAGYAWVKFYDGTQTAADPMMFEKYSADPNYPYTADMVGTGICYAIATFRLDRDLFPGAPVVTFEVDGIKLYDPRKDSSVGGSGSHRWGVTATYESTDNQAVMAYNILRGIPIGADVWGGECSADDLPLDTWFAAMNACDVPVTNGDGSTEPAYRAAYAVTVDMQPADVLDALKATCSGEFAEIGGIFKMRVGGPGLPVYFMTDDDVIVTSADQMAPFPGLDQTFNAVNASYPDPASLYQSKAAPVRTSATYQAADGNRYLPAAVNLPACPYPNQVQRLQLALLQDHRRFAQHQHVLPPDAIVLEPLDAYSWSSDWNGYDSKLFEVTQVADDQAKCLQTVSGRERDASDYSWASSYELPASAPVAAGGNPPGNYLADIGFSVAGLLRVVNQQVIGVLRVTIGAVNANVGAYEVDYRVSGTTDWVSMGASSSQVYEAAGISDGSYDVRVRAISLNWVRGPYSEQDSIFIAAFGAPPADVQGFSGVVVDSVLHLTWKAVPDLDLSNYKLRYSPLTSGATYQQAVDLLTSIPRPAVSTVVPAQTGTYFLKAVDKMGNVSVNPAVTVVVTNLAALAGFNAVELLTEEPAWAGALTNTIALNDGISPMVKLASTTNWQEITDDWTTITTNWQDLGDHATSGTYEFASIVDLGAVYTSRVSSHVEVDIEIYGTDWQTIFMPWETDTSNWQIDPATIDKVSVAFEVSTTNDDPAGAPAWSGWQPVIVADLTARALRFRLVLSSADGTVTPVVRSAVAKIDMPDRTLSEGSVAFTGSKTVVFVPPLKTLKSLGFAVSDMNSGDVPKVTGRGPTGFTITVYDSMGAVSTTPNLLDYQAIGYGVSS